MLGRRLALLTIGILSIGGAACSLLYSTEGLSSDNADADATVPFDGEAGESDTGAGEGSPPADAATDALADVDALDDLGLIGEWHFDETSGLTAKDTSGFGRHAALSGGVGFVTNGTAGGAVEFDGGGIVRVVGLDGSEFPRSGTLSLHYWRTDAPPTYGRNIFDAYHTTRSPHLFLRWVDSDGAMQVVFQGDEDGGAYLFATVFSDPGALWRHVVIVWDEAKGTGAVWVDGALLKDATTAKPFAPTGEEFRMGQYFVGRVDEVRLYARPLSAKEVALLP